jgi:hypothetical protein
VSEFDKLAGEAEKFGEQEAENKLGAGQQGRTRASKGTRSPSKNVLSRGGYLAVDVYPGRRVAGRALRAPARLAVPRRTGFARLLAAGL